MSHDDCKQIRELFLIKFEALEKRMDERFNAFDKRTDRMIESSNGKNLMLDNRIDETDEKQQKQIDNHCVRLRETEKSIVKLEPLRNLYSKMGSFAIGLIILLGSAVIAVAVFLKESLTK